MRKKKNILGASPAHRTDITFSPSLIRALSALNLIVDFVFTRSHKKIKYL